MPVILEPESGCILDPARADEVLAIRMERGDAVMASAFAAASRPDLTGYWERLKKTGVKGVFLRDAEPRLLKGLHRRPFLQKRGTCVSRGGCRAAQTSLDYDIAMRYGLSVATELSFAQLYSDARHLGGDRFKSDGAITANVAWTLHDYGVAPQSPLFSGMTEDEQEQLAVKYAAPGVKTPPEWRAAAKGHTAATFLPDSLPSVFDCIAAGYASVYAMSRITAMPDANGVSRPGKTGAHCRYFSSVFVDENGDDQLGSTESWGRFPAGDAHSEDQTMPVEKIPRITLRYAGGVRKLAPGEVGVNAKQFYELIRTGGEVWAIGVTRAFTTNAIADLNRSAASSVS
jgi:hypothetical protein